MSGSNDKNSNRDTDRDTDSDDDIDDDISIITTPTIVPTTPTTPATPTIVPMNHNESQNVIKLGTSNNNTEENDNTNIVNTLISTQINVEESTNTIQVKKLNNDIYQILNNDIIRLYNDVRQNMSGNYFDVIGNISKKFINAMYYEDSLDDDNVIKYNLINKAFDSFPDNSYINAIYKYHDEEKITINKTKDTNLNIEIKNLSENSLLVKLKNKYIKKSNILFGLKYDKYVISSKFVNKIFINLIIDRIIYRTYNNNNKNIKIFGTIKNSFIGKEKIDGYMIHDDFFNANSNLAKIKKENINCIVIDSNANNFGQDFDIKCIYLFSKIVEYFNKLHKIYTKEHAIYYSSNPDLDCKFNHGNLTANNVVINFFKDNNGGKNDKDYGDNALRNFKIHLLNLDNSSINYYGARYTSQIPKKYILFKNNFNETENKLIEEFYKRLAGVSFDKHEFENPITNVKIFKKMLRYSKIPVPFAIEFYILIISICLNNSDTFLNFFTKYFFGTLFDINFDVDKLNKNTYINNQFLKASTSYKVYELIKQNSKSFSGINKIDKPFEILCSANVIYKINILKLLNDTIEKYLKNEEKTTYPNLINISNISNINEYYNINIQKLYIFVNLNLKDREISKYYNAPKKIYFDPTRKYEESKMKMVQKNFFESESLFKKMFNQFNIDPSLNIYTCEIKMNENDQYSVVDNNIILTLKKYFKIGTVLKSNNGKVYTIIDYKWKVGTWVKNNYGIKSIETERNKINKNIKQGKCGFQFDMNNKNLFEEKTYSTKNNATNCSQIETIIDINLNDFDVEMIIQKENENKIKRQEYINEVVNKLKNIKFNKPINFEKILNFFSNFNQPQSEKETINNINSFYNLIDSFFKTKNKNEQVNEGINWKMYDDMLSNFFERTLGFIINKIIQMYNSSNIYIRLLNLLFKIKEYFLSSIQLNATVEKIINKIFIKSNDLNTFIEKFKVITTQDNISIILADQYLKYILFSNYLEFIDNLKKDDNLKNKNIYNNYYHILEINDEIHDNKKNLLKNNNYKNNLFKNEKENYKIFFNKEISNLNNISKIIQNEIFNLNYFNNENNNNNSEPYLNVLFEIDKYIQYFKIMSLFNETKNNIINTNINLESNNEDNIDIADNNQLYLFVENIAKLFSRNKENEQKKEEKHEINIEMSEMNNRKLSDYTSSDTSSDTSFDTSYISDTSNILSLLNNLQHFRCQNLTLKQYSQNKLMSILKNICNDGKLINLENANQENNEQNLNNNMKKNFEEIKFNIHSEININLLSYFISYSIAYFITKNKNIIKNIQNCDILNINYDLLKLINDLIKKINVNNYEITNDEINLTTIINNYLDKNIIYKEINNDYNNINYNIKYINELSNRLNIQIYVYDDNKIISHSGLKNPLCYLFLKKNGDNYVLMKINDDILFTCEKLPKEIQIKEYCYKEPNEENSDNLLINCNNAENNDESNFLGGTNNSNTDEDNIKQLKIKIDLLETVSKNKELDENQQTELLNYRKKLAELENNLIPKSYGIVVDLILYPGENPSLMDRQKYKCNNSLNDLKKEYCEIFGFGCSEKNKKGGTMKCSKNINDYLLKNNTRKNKK